MNSRRGRPWGAIAGVVAVAAVLLMVSGCPDGSLPDLIVQNGGDPATYTVTYDANEATSGTVPSSQTKTHGVALTLATNSGNLARTGYSFALRSTQADGSGTDCAAGAHREHRQSA